MLPHFPIAESHTECPARSPSNGTRRRCSPCCARPRCHARPSSRTASFSRCTACFESIVADGRRPSCWRCRSSRTTRVSAYEWTSASRLSRYCTSDTISRECAGGSGVTAAPARSHSTGRRQPPTTAVGRAAGCAIAARRYRPRHSLSIAHSSCRDALAGPCAAIPFVPLDDGGKRLHVDAPRHTSRTPARWLVVSRLPVDLDRQRTGLSYSESDRHAAWFTMPPYPPQKNGAAQAPR